jgi:DNA repair protein RadA/Sms
MGETILYFTEEPEIVWQDRLKQLDLVRRRGLNLIFAMGMPLKMMIDITVRGDETVVMLDTLGGLRLLGDDRNHNEEVAKAMEPWLLACREGNKNLIALTHDRKSGGSKGEGVSGGTSLVASVDMVLEIRRVPKKPTQRVVSALGRRVQPPNLIYERMADGTMKVVKEVTAEELKQAFAKKSNESKPAKCIRRSAPNGIQALGWRLLVGRQ